MLTSLSNILERSICYSEDAYLTQAIKSIYSSVVQIKGRGAPLERMRILERKVAATGGLWIKTHDGIDSAFDILFTRWETALLKKVGETFDAMHKNFSELCDSTQTKDPEEKAKEEALRKELRVNLEKVKKMTEQGGEIARLVEQCKTYHAQCGKGASELFVQ